MGSPDRSERTLALRQAVLEALGRARQQYDGRLSRLLMALETEAVREGLTKDDFYRAAHPETIDRLSASKLSRLQDVLERAGMAGPRREAGSELQRAILALSRITRAPERFRRALPKTLFCLRRSYLVPGAVNVSYVEIEAEDLALRYRETRAGSLGAASQRAVLAGTVLHHDDLDDVYYVIGLNEFRTSFAVEETTSVHSNLVSLSILRQCAAESFGAFFGIHLGVMPDNNPDYPAAPYAARQLLIETRQTLAESAQKGLIQNHPETVLPNLPGWQPDERRLLARYLDQAGLSNATVPGYDLLVAGPPRNGSPGASADAGPARRTGRRTRQA